MFRREVNVTAVVVVLSGDVTAVAASAAAAAMLLVSSELKTSRPPFSDLGESRNLFSWIIISIDRPNDALL